MPSRPALSHSALRASALATIALVCALLIAAAPAEAAKRAPKTAAASLRALVAGTQKLSPSTASAAKRFALLRHATMAQATAKATPCAAVRHLGMYRRTLRTIPVKRKAGAAQRQLASLGTLSTQATTRLLALKRTRSCGGGVAPSKLSRTRTNIGTSTPGRLKVTVDMPELKLTGTVAGGKTWTDLDLPNGSTPQDPGDPAIPYVSQEFAVPEGAKVTYTAEAEDSYTIPDVDVLPAQPKTVDAGNTTKSPNFLDGVFETKPFTFDPKAYNSNKLFPAAQADVDVLGTARDLTIGTVRIPAAQYNPKTRTLTVLKNVKINIKFTGGTGKFGVPVGSPYEQFGHDQALAMINTKAILKYPILPPPPKPCGEELLVITNPSTRSAADTFAAARNAAGILTRVVETGPVDATHIGTTNTEIRDFIRARLTPILTHVCVRPSYVAIIGDDELVSTFATSMSPGLSATPIPSDLEYSLANDSDLLPDLAVGRIVGNDLAEVTAAVNKIIAYETTPLTGAILSKAMVASQFQDDNGDGRDDRTFINFSQKVYTGLRARGVTVDRVYGREPHAATAPALFDDGTALPPSLQAPFAWDGTGADVTSNWNEGRFLVVHRDHGWSDGWGTPFFTTTEVDALTNGANLPVVLSINCASGAYDFDETSFVQRALVSPNGGAVGVFGDTRNSWSWHNSQIALGFMDGLLPNMVAGEGPDNPQRLGDALVTGKRRMATMVPPPDGGTIDMLHLWHLFGDPTMQMWGGGKIKDFGNIRFDHLILARVLDPKPGDPPYKVSVAGLPATLAGQPISIVYKGTVVGKAVGQTTPFEIPASFGDATPGPGELKLAFEADGAPAATYDIAAAPQPVLTQTCPTSTYQYSNMVINGTLTNVPAGTEVQVTFQSPNPAHTVVKTATTDANGNWTASEIPGNGGTGTWTVTSRFAGTATLGATSTTCTVQV